MLSTNYLGYFSVLALVWETIHGPPPLPDILKAKYIVYRTLLLYIPALLDELPIAPLITEPGPEALAEPALPPPAKLY